MRTIIPAHIQINSKLILQAETGPSPRPSSKKDTSRNTINRTKILDIMADFKLSLMKEQCRREEEHRIRMLDREDEKRRLTEDRRILEQRWAEEKAARHEERERREEERRRSNQIMQVFMIAVIGKTQTGLLSNLFKRRAVSSKLYPFSSLVFVLQVTVAISSLGSPKRHLLQRLDEAYM